MPVQYILTYLDSWHWDKWKKLPESEQKKIKKYIQRYVYKILGNPKGAPKK